MFERILIANRGEIACRIARSARRLGVRTVAVYSDADAGAMHVAACDEAYRIGPPPPRESYLDGEAIIAAALRSGAQAIHPGYGFLSENPAFAAACTKAGIAFIGPPAAAIAAMGSKATAKRIMAEAGVPIPLVPGYHGENQNPALLAREAAAIGYPLLIKATAGAGGKGMRIVERAGDFPAALDSARREAQSSFGDDRVLLEKYLAAARHIEIQVFGDAHDGMVHLFERDCSLQRRHQKVVEEAPAPGMTAQQREAMGAAAVAAAKAIGYVGAGTVEFIAGQDGRFYFMEMNTRLQVEHAVTEMITGIDLVEWQLRVARGEPLPKRQAALAIDGHAIEARIYAEDPERGFLPSIGRLAHLRMPEADAHMRIDIGVRAGDEISPHYDPMIAKLIVRGGDRGEALQRLGKALGECEIAGVATNLAFLQRVVEHEAFVAGRIDTGLIARHREALFPPPEPVSARALLAAALAELAVVTDRAAARARTSGDPHSPWNAIDAWWPNSSRHGPDFTFRDGEAAHAVFLRKAADGWRATLPPAVHAGEIDAAMTLHDGRLRIEWSEARGDGIGPAGATEFTATVVAVGEERWVFCDGGERRLVLIDPLAHGGEDEAAGGHLAAPMSGAVVAVMVKAGDSVGKGSALMILEAMKMEHTITAPAAGVVAAVNFRVGDRVDEGADLVHIVPAVHSGERATTMRTTR